MIWLQNALAFLVTLGILVSIHEFGHYIVARWCNVKVLRFSLGMGKVIYSKRLGKDQTEWAISILPLGGYVKMLDAREMGAENIAASELPREFCQQSVWKRIAIVSAGPIANFLLAIFLYTILFVHGVPEPAAKLRVIPDTSIAYQAGLRYGDLITAVNGQQVQGWTEFRWKMMQAGLAEGNTLLEVLRIDGTAQEGGKNVSIEIPLKQFNSKDADSDILNFLGLNLARSREIILKGFLPESPAFLAGLQVGDRIVEVEQKPLLDVIDFVQVVNANPSKPLKLLVQRRQEKFVLEVTPVSQESNGKTVGALRVELQVAPLEMTVVQANPLQAFAKSVEKTWDTSIFSLKMIGKMLTGNASLKHVTGPLTIADYAGQTSRTGLITYLSFIAVISISLGVMNLLPIPVLDGGYLLYYSLEVLTGKPLHDRYIEVGKQAGLFLLLMMMAIAFFNDIVRLIPYFGRLMS
ncbi:RIP metalloprotease RseP [Undibacterium umbellatum]|uniref:Zinc metalloprotease n=1 Tax=Undibacterium umbellatum TaxID=2762300 RepID=A0ABR6Z4S5_9BURK|nr:RIP metalloprotease RseP [Undibacterium umbellatum]MBC3906152.1 RIP metalloprotease RseP [Undibacterium umbellatum]